MISRFNIIHFLIVFVPLSINAQSNAPVEVHSITELHAAIAHAIPGIPIVLQDGMYDGDELIISASGTNEKPIMIEAKNSGKALIHTPVKIKGDHISISGLKFSKFGEIEIAGSGIRISRCVMSDVKTAKWIRVLPGSSNIEFDYNLFENKQSNLDFERGCQLMQIIVRNENEQHHIHHNLFRDIHEGSGNGFETLQLITENNPFDPAPGACNSIIEDNLFLRCNGESEIISVKSNGNILRRNTFRACKGGALVLRHGDNNVVTGNFFFGDGEEGSGGVRIQGTGQVVANNYFHGLQRYGFGMMDGTPDDLYIRVEDAQILFNTFISCNNTFQIGLNHSKHPNGTTPKNCLIAGNIFYSDSRDSELESNLPFVVYVKNDQPENWQWKDNVTFGNPLQKPFDGLYARDPHLEYGNKEVAVPTGKTPAMKHTLELDDLIKLDVLGLERKERKTIGAIQFPAEVSGKNIMTADMVGPFSWK